MNSRRTKFFNVYYADIDIDVIGPIVTAIDEMYEWVIDFFELMETTVMFDFYLCPDVEAFQFYAMKSDDTYQDWMVGNTDYTNNRICILSPRAVKDRSFEDMIKVIKHEIIHIALSALAAQDEASICMAEGIAVAFAEQIYIPSLDVNDHPRYIDLLDEEFFYENNGYNYAGVYVLYLLKKYGKNTFKNIYSGKERIEEYLFDGFEKEAISDLVSDRQDLDC